MKKFGLVLSTLLLSHVVFCQIQEEDFSQDHLPNGWQSSAVNGNVEWQFGYNGVMPHSGPTIESEFDSGAALLIGAGVDCAEADEVSLISPAVDLTVVDQARIEVTYNLQADQEKAAFSIEVYDGKLWRQVFFQDSSSPKNTGLNELVSFDISDFINERFQVKFVYIDKGSDHDSGLGIANYRLIDGDGFELGANMADLGLNGLLNFSDNVLVLDAADQLEDIDFLDSLRSHMKEYERGGMVRQANRVPVSASIFKIKGETMLGSYKVLTP